LYFNLFFAQSCYLFLFALYKHVCITFQPTHVATGGGGGGSFSSNNGGGGGGSSSSSSGGGFVIGRER
jgi:hypothetical protein